MHFRAAVILHIANESVPKIIINNTVNLFFKLRSACHECFCCHINGTDRRTDGQAAERRTGIHASITSLCQPSFLGPQPLRWPQSGLGLRQLSIEICRPRPSCSKPAAHRCRYRYRSTVQTDRRTDTRPLHILLPHTVQPASAIVVDYYMYKKVNARYSGSPLVSNPASPLRELKRHMGWHSVTCHPAEVTFSPLP